MAKEEDFKLLKIQTCVLRVNIHCDGCKQKVKKLLQKIEGVYKVDVDAEQQKVTVSGSLDSSALIKKLLRAGKHAELWSQKSNHNQKSQQTQCIKDDKKAKGQNQGLIKGLNALKNQHLPSFSLEDHDDCDDDGDDMEEELKFIREKANHLGLLGQANETNVKKALAAAAAAANNNQAGNGGVNGNVGKKGGGNPTQNGGLPDHKNISFAANNKLNSNTHLGLSGIGNSNGSGISPGFHGHGAGVGLGSNGLGFQAQPNTFQGSVLPSSALGSGQHPPPMMMNMQGHQNYPSSMATNMNMHNRYMQPQMMYHRSPPVHPYTGYYQQYHPDPSYYQENATYGAHIDNDEPTDSCAIM